MNRGDFHWCNLDPVQVHEQRGYRPVLLVSEDDYHNGPAELVIVVPVTSARKPYSNRIDCPATARNGLSNDSQILADQVRCVSIGRIGSRLGQCEDDVFEEVLDDLRIVLGL